MKSIRTNYHTHTERCSHAKGSDESYVRNAILGGFDLLGFSDHTPWPFSDGYRSFMRMEANDLEEYVNSVMSLRAKYSDQIEVKLGLECEFFVDYISWLKEQKEKYSIDYMIFGNHFPYKEEGVLYFGNTYSHSDLKLYQDVAIEGLLSGVYDYFAHPELFMRTYPKVDDYCEGIFRDIVIAAREMNVVMEHNTTMPYYERLWEIVAEEQPKVIVGMDVHDSVLLSNPEVYEEAEARLLKLGITPIKQL